MKTKMEIKIRYFKVLLIEQKILTTPLKICCLWIWKKPSTLDGNLNVRYMWQNNAVNFLQISFKGQRLIIVVVLVIIYCFEATCFIFSFSSVFWKFQIYQYLGSLKFIDSFFKDMTKTMTGYFLLQPLYLCYE